MLRLAHDPERETARAARPASLQEQPEEDPYRYGWRTLRGPTPNGGEEHWFVPLTLEDLLDPQEGDHATQDTLHHKLVAILNSLLERRYREDDSVAVFSDLKVRFNVPGLAGPAPDVYVVRGVRDRARRRRSFQADKESGDIIFVVEVVSTDSAAKDYAFNRLVYEKAGIPGYLIVDPQGEYLTDPCKLTGYRLDATHRYRPIQPQEGRLFSETTDLWFAADPEGGGVKAVDAATGQPLLTADEESERAAKTIRQAAKAVEQAAKEAERADKEAQRADRVAAARRALEKKLARLQPRRRGGKKG